MTGVLFPHDFFPDSNLQLVAEGAATQLAALSLSKQHGVEQSSVELSKYQDRHSFTIIANMLADERLEPSKIRRVDSDAPFAETLENVGEIIREYAKQWIVPTDGNLVPLRGKIEELQWLSTIVFGMGGWREGYKFRSDFFL